MWKWLMRKLPKRVIKRENGIFYPQVWFMWWHYVWTTYYESCTPESFETMDEAVLLLETKWKDCSVPKSVTVVWRGK